MPSSCVLRCLGSLYAYAFTLFACVHDFYFISVVYKRGNKRASFDVSWELLSELCMQL